MFPTSLRATQTARGAGGRGVTQPDWSLRMNAETRVGKVSMPTSEECEDVLRRHVIDVWFPRSLDLEWGGFFCDFDRLQVFHASYRDRQIAHQRDSEIE